MAVLAFAEEGCDVVARSGGKGASLARMFALGLPVPPGFVVTADALASSLSDGGAELRRLVVGGGTHAAVAERAQQLVRVAAPPSPLRDAIAGAYAKLGDGEPPVAVRSSACAEDGQAASFAGQQETYLHVRGAERVIERMRECWASFFSERALFYRAQKGSLEDLGMAVVVQRMVDADVSGVLFTIDPVRRRHDRMVVEAVFGLGEAVVSGAVTPDHYIIKRDGSIWRQKLNVQPYAIVSAPGGGTRRRELTEEEGAVATLDHEQLRALAVIGEGLQRRTGQAQDIEWAVHDGRLYVLQARPVTA